MALSPNGLTVDRAKLDPRWEQGSASVVGRKQLANLDAECLCEIGDDPEGRISLTAFHATDVGPVTIRAICELFLCPTASFTEHPYATPESLLDRHGQRFDDA